MTIKNEKKAMSNVKLSVKGDKLNISIDIKAFKDVQDLPISSSGKTYLLASTNGTEKLAGDVLDGLGLSLNVMAYKKPYDEKIALKNNRKVAKSAKDEIAASKDIASKLAGIEPAKLELLMKLIESL